MSPPDARQAFIEWVAKMRRQAEGLLQDDLKRPPRSYFTEGSSLAANDFFERAEKWRRFRLGVVTGLRSHVKNCDHLVEDASERLADRNLMAFTITAINNAYGSKSFDLSNRRMYEVGVDWQELHEWFARGNESPMWDIARNTMLKEVQTFTAMLVEDAETFRYVADDHHSSAVPTASPTAYDFPLGDALTVEPAVPASTRYVCRESLGEGAYGEAFRGFDTALQRDVVIKFIRLTGATRNDAIEQGRALARVTDPCIVVVFDVAKVVDPVTNLVMDAVVMELVEGRSLVERVGRAVHSDEALRIGNAVLDAVEAYHSRGLVHLDLHDGNVIVGDRFVKVIDPMYFETVALKSSATRDAQQQREVRRARDILVDLLRASDVPMDDVVRFEHVVAKPTIELLRSEFRQLLQRQVPATVTESPGRDVSLVTGFQPGPLAEIARAVISKLASLGDGVQRGFVGHLDIATFANDIGRPFEVVRDVFVLLERQTFVTLERMNKLSRLTQRGREEAHRLGEGLSSPKHDSERLHAYLMEQGDGDLRGHGVFDQTILCPALALTLPQLHDAGRELKWAGLCKMTMSTSNTWIELSARGREAGRHLRPAG